MIVFFVINKNTALAEGKEDPNPPPKQPGSVGVARSRLDAMSLSRELSSSFGGGPSSFANKPLREWEDPGERWPRLLYEKFDVTVGALQPIQVMNTLLHWTMKDTIGMDDLTTLTSSTTTATNGMRRLSSVQKIRRSLLSRRGSSQGY